MRMKTIVRGLGLALLVSTAGCKSLDITNPNEPDVGRLLADPEGVLVGGGMATWVKTFHGANGNGPLVTQAQTYSASWNNWNMNFYSGLDGYTEGTFVGATRNTRAWVNDPASGRRLPMEHFWTGYYSSLALVNAVLKAIRVDGFELTTVSDTRRAEAVALLVAGASLSGIAINYDQGYVIDENTDLTAPFVFVNRKIVRDAALAKFDEAIALAGANVFTTPGSWLNGNTYTNVEIAKAANTMAAFLLANWPRDATEAGAVNWGQVVTYAQNGLSSGTPTEFGFVGDGCSAWCAEILVWFNSVDTGRLHTRVANMLDASQLTPYPAGGNPQPASLDARLGNGAFGTDDMVAGFGNIPLDATNTAGAGTDFMFSTQELFNPSRGTFHQSNIGHMRYDLSGEQASNSMYSGFGPAPLFSSGQNDLLWAEGLLRQGAPNLALAATKINNTRVTRGGLTGVAAGDGAPALLAALSYENEIEVLGLGAASYYHRRRAVGGLITGTPREMPVPAKELGVRALPLYTWGGTGPANSLTPP